MTDSRRLRSVLDTGRGIDPDQVDRVFDRFHQVEESDTIEHGGLGLGLSLSRDLIELHGGRIWVETNLGPGSTFLFTVRKHADVALYEPR